MDNNDLESQLITNPQPLQQSFNNSSRCPSCDNCCFKCLKYFTVVNSKGNICEIDLCNCYYKIFCCESKCMNCEYKCCFLNCDLDNCTCWC